MQNRILKRDTRTKESEYTRHLLIHHQLHSPSCHSRIMSPFPPGHDDRGIVNLSHLQRQLSGPLKSINKHTLQGSPMEPNTAYNRQMPQVMAAANKVKHSWIPLLRNLTGVDGRADKVDRQRLEKWQIEANTPGSTAGVKELSEREEAGGAEGDVEDDAEDAVVRAVEDGSPGEDYADCAEEDGEGHVKGSGEGFVVEGSVLFIIKDDLSNEVHLGVI